MRRFFTLGPLLLLALSAFVLLVYPLYVMRPFKHQVQQDLFRALEIVRIAPAASILLAVAALALLLFTWRNLRPLSRATALLLVLLTCAAAGLIRVNIFEKMFHPAGTPGFIAVADAHAKAKIDPEDMLLTVSFNDAAHAYPIRTMGYHHVVNDLVGGVPIVATY